MAYPSLKYEMQRDVRRERDRACPAKIYSLLDLVFCLCVMQGWTMEVLQNHYIHGNAPLLLLLCVRNFAWLPAAVPCSLVLP